MHNSNAARDLWKFQHRRWRLTIVGAAALAALFALPASWAPAHAAGVGTARTAADSSCPWVTSTAPISQRVAQLMSHMTLADKITMVEGHGTSNPYVFYTPAIPSLCIPAVGLEDGPAGVADGMTGVTQLPAGVSLAASWDPSLARQYGTVIGAEENGKGASANLGPTVNIDRDPRWGRSFEALSEDPYLNSALDVPEIDGIQSQDVEDQVKHYDAYNQETYRNTSADNDGALAGTDQEQPFNTNFGPQLLPQPSGTREEALDCACGLYLNDPTAWLTPPGTDAPTDLRAGALDLAMWMTQGAVSSRCYGGDRSTVSRYCTLVSSDTNIHGIHMKLRPLP